MPEYTTKLILGTFIPFFLFEDMCVVNDSGKTAVLKPPQGSMQKRETQGREDYGIVCHPLHNRTDSVPCFVVIMS